MRKKKIRGHRKRWKKIDQWIEGNKNLDVESLQLHQRDYCKIWVHPWSGLSITNSQIPNIKGQTKSKILNGLVSIHNSWKTALDQLGQPYYLRIWLFDQRFNHSQVVCAIGSFLDFYELTFYKPDEAKSFSPINFGENSEQLSAFEWEYRLDEEHISDQDLEAPEMYESQSDYNDDVRYYDQFKKRAQRHLQETNSEGKLVNYYSLKMGAVWLGKM